MQLSTRGQVCPDVPSEPNSRQRGARRTAPNHQADGPLSPKDAALHMTDVASLRVAPRSASVKHQNNPAALRRSSGGPANDVEL